MSFTWLRITAKRQSASSKEGGKRRRQGIRAGPVVELLETRCVPSDFRSITGFGNNIVHPTWGQAGTHLFRVSPVAYADGISLPSTPNTLSPREISNNLNNQSNPIFSFADNIGKRAKGKEGNQDQQHDDRRRDRLMKRATPNFGQESANGR